MNVPVLVVAIFTLLAFFAHLIGGTRETASLVPAASEEKLMLNWKQAMCAFQMLAVDLLAVAAVLFTIALTEIITIEKELLLILSALYFLWGLVWLLQLLFLKSGVKTCLWLPQWIFWFVGSGLLYLGA